MPIDTRCPACSAAVPSRAAWCSLCHAELRARTATNPTSVDVVPSGRTTGPTTAARPASASARSAAEYDAHEAAAELSAYATEPLADTDDRDSDDADHEPVGRHSRRDPAPERPVRREPGPASQPGGRRAVRGAPSTSSLATLELDGVVIPQGQVVSPEEAEALADQLIARLALSEPRPRVLDPSDIPGGRWTLVGGGMAAVLALLLVVFTVLGAVLDR